MVIDENWGVSIQRVREFFEVQPDVIQEEQDFRFGRCRITLTPVSGTLLGKWEMPRTRLQMEGPEEEVQIIHRRFYLRFLSAGG